MDKLHDPRVGSARDNGTSTTVTSAGSSTNSSSLSSLLWTLVPMLVYAALCIIIFLTLRRGSPQVYAPRSISSRLAPHERSPKLPSGWFNWIKPFCRIPDTYILNHSSLDSYLFLRFLKILTVICFVGVCITWPILIPVHATGGGVETQLDRLAFGNVVYPVRFWAHAAVLWLYFGFVLYMISRECIYYVHLRQAYLHSPFYAKRLSSRTVLFTCIPREYRDQAKLRKIFGDSAKTIWLPKWSNELENFVEERRQTALRLEGAELALIKMANAARTKSMKAGDFAIKARPHPKLQKPRRESSQRTSGRDLQPNSPASFRQESRSRRLSPLEKPELDPSSPSSLREDSRQTYSPEKADVESDAALPLPDVNGSVASQWIPASARPHHRPIANKGRRSDTIKWTRFRLKTLKVIIRRLRRQQVASQDNAMPVAFIEFTSQADAQSAFQTLTHHRAMHMSPRYIGVRPFEIVWKNLSMAWWERIIRQFAVDAGVAVLILFWALPCALVGIISNVHYLAEKVVFLRWLEDLPSPVLGLISGLLPSVALSFLMNIVPWILRTMGVAAGIPTLSLIELYSQKCYFAFQIVQVFLITTLTSAASAAAAQIIENPNEAESLLSKNLPTASNFYISYILVQSLGFGGSALVHAGSYVRLRVLQKFTSNPRRLWLRWHRLKVIHWGRLFPIWTNMGVIALSYACIAPIVLGFATVGVYFAYVVYRYNILFVYDSEISMSGLSYPRALMHLMVGVYFGEVCLIGLLVLKKAYGPLGLSFCLLIFTALVNFSLYNAVGPLLESLPKTLAVEAQEERGEGDAQEKSTTSLPLQMPDPSTTSPDNFDFGQTNDFNFGEDLPQEQQNHHQPSSQEPIPSINLPNNDGFGQSHDFDFGFNDPPLPHHQHHQNPNSVSDSDSDSDHIEHVPGATRAPEGIPNTVSTATTFLHSQALSRASPYLTHLSPLLTPFRLLNRKLITPTRLTNPNPNFFIRWLHPEIYQDYSVLRSLIPHDEYPPDPSYPSDLADQVYYPPYMFEEPPLLWIPRDPGGISAQEVAHTSKVNPITDSWAEIDEKGGLKVDLDGVPLAGRTEGRGMRW